MMRTRGARQGRRRRIALRTMTAVALVGASVMGVAPSTGADPDAPGGVSADLVLWLDASDPNGDGIAPANGTAISSWADLSGRGNEATVNPYGRVQPNTPATFTSSVPEFGGRPAMRFTRIDDESGSVYQTADLDIRASARPDLTVFAVYLPVTRSSNNGVWGADDGGWDRFFLSYHPAFGDRIDDGLVSLGPALAGETIADAGTSDVPHMMTVGYSGNVVGGVNRGEAGASYVFFNCQLERTFTDSTHATAARTTMSVGWDGDNSVFDGYIAEVIAYDRTLDAGELSSVYRYLATKYGLESGCAEFVDSAPTDTDGDGTLDDLNGDGVTDDLDGDGTIDDTDGDGIADDTDGDGIADDLDGDGVSDDRNGDGIPEDADGDGVPDLVDPDDVPGDADGDGLPEDADGDGVPDVAEDADGDGVPDVAEDADGDGVPDVAEDADGDGTPGAELPATGSNIGGAPLAASVLLAAGAAMLVARGRRAAR